MASRLEEISVALSRLQGRLDRLAPEVGFQRLERLASRTTELATYVKSPARTRTYAPQEIARLTRDVVEAAEISEVDLYFSDDELRALLPKLIKSLKKGPDDLFDERDGSAEARNTLFELTMAAVLRRAGIDSVPDKRGNSPDVVVHVPPARLMLNIQCKRPVSLSSAANCLRKARRQFKKGCHLSNGRAGAFALSLSRAFLDGHGNEILSGSTVEAIKRRVHLYVDELKALSGPTELRQQLRKVQLDPDVAGGFYYIAFPAHIPSRNLFIVYTTVTTHKLDDGRGGEAIRWVGDRLNEIEGWVAA